MQSTKTWPERAALMIHEVALDVGRLKADAARDPMADRAAFERAVRAMETKLEAARQGLAEIDTKEAWNRLTNELGCMWSDLCDMVRSRG